MCLIASMVMPVAILIGSFYPCNVALVEKDKDSRSAMYVKGLTVPILAGVESVEVDAYRNDALKTLDPVIKNQVELALNLVGIRTRGSNVAARLLIRVDSLVNLDDRTHVPQFASSVRLSLEAPVISRENGAASIASVWQASRVVSGTFEVIREQVAESLIEILDQFLLDWIEANPNEPRSEAVRRMIPLKRQWCSENDLEGHYLFFVLSRALNYRGLWQRLFAPDGSDEADAWGRGVWKIIGAPGFCYSRTELFSSGGQSHWIIVAVNLATGLEFSLVPGGIVRLGASKGEQNGKNENEPGRRVQVSPFLVSRTEVTQAAWENLMRYNRSTHKGATLPVHSVNWREARHWCRRAGLRLPTEAEWEFACRAGTYTDFSFGNFSGAVDDYAWTRRAWSYKDMDYLPQPVGGKLPNAFGLFDMHGNVSEWVEDNEDLSLEDTRIPLGPVPVGGMPSFGLGDPNVVSRGGSILNFPHKCRSSSRQPYSHLHASECIGFRPAACVGIK